MSLISLLRRQILISSTSDRGIRMIEALEVRKPRQVIAPSETGDRFGLVLKHLAAQITGSDCRDRAQPSQWARGPDPRT